MITSPQPAGVGTVLVSPSSSPASLPVALLLVHIAGKGRRSSRSLDETVPVHSCGYSAGTEIPAVPWPLSLPCGGRKASLTQADTCFWMAKPHRPGFCDLPRSHLGQQIPAPNTWTREPSTSLVKRILSTFVYLFSGWTHSVCSIVCSSVPSFLFLDNQNVLLSSKNKTWRSFRLEVFLGKQAKEASPEFDSTSLISPQYFFPIYHVCSLAFSWAKGLSLDMPMRDSLRHQNICSGLWSSFPGLELKDSARSLAEAVASLWFRASWLRR